MKPLMYKEFTLSAAPLTYIFVAFGLMTLIPGYPILLAGFFICLGILYTFQFAREYSDVLYAVLLPVKKRDVVKARYLFVVCVQWAGMLLCGLLTLLRMTALREAQVYQANPMMNANLTFLGFLLVIMTLFNTLFLGGFYRTAYYYGKPFILFSIAAFGVVGVGETLHHISGLGWLNVSSGAGVGAQAVVLLGGAGVYAAGTLLSMKRSEERFEKMDLGG
ncbi:MAG: ABC-2 transporter permease [Lachnospiraceae bacterium]|nr:ABC-2 transporter permease [Lachnospiraceae bacterium]